MSNKHLLLFAAEFLERYSDELGNNGCNDQHWPEGWTMEQKIDFLRQYYKYNSKTEKPGDAEYEELEYDMKKAEEGGKYAPMDFACASLLASLLKTEAGKIDE